ncbi:MAG: hypothetical protein KC656_30025 [Myxococcales bacterium]|nr:hypothetical protein [Myxococcales bacterium]
MDRLILRPAVHGDSFRLLALYHDGFAVYGARAYPMPALRHAVVAEVDGEIVGDPAWRRRGIGRALVLGGLEIAELDGAGAAFAHCVAASGSRELVASLGFVELCFRPHHYAAGQGMHLMRISLPGAP